MALQFSYPYELVPTRVRSLKLPRYPVDIVTSGGLVETRTLTQTDSGAFAELVLAYDIADDCKVTELIKFWVTVKGTYSAFSIPEDHGIWAQLSFSKTFLSIVDNAFRFDSEPVINTLTDSLVAWTVTLKQLIYEDLSTD